MTRLLRVGLVVALVMSLIAAAGCGGSDTKKSNDYVKDINQIQTEFAASITKVQSNAGTGTEAVQNTFTGMQDAIDKVIKDLENIKPPDKVKDLHNKLIKELETFNKAVANAADAVTSKDPQKILAAQSSFA